ncbi:response regulator transcription factor [Glaciimonas sp. Gout2]|uniref:response regulator transcription factor n=1 Tax=unclassified Glaciimonas TaxID=2644401 RepID=UPI002B23629E|nr:MULTISPECIES: response regulator transcription factor [unclassified Glaciimonas]MEB0010578.1 response regulator transcription factor [Glaciimonas sp. Cout2]MEB0084444.1 response regulator transcription factor [Glaciimonas sp. Gout2]
MRLLLVEDDLMVGEAVRKGLRLDGFAVDWVQDGKAAEVAVAQEDYELLLLDLGLPKKNGLDVLKSLRARGSQIPVLILTARDAIADRVAGLDAGADDYLIKPFDLEELAARIRALLRRQSGRADPVIEVGQLTLNPATHEVRLEGCEINLSAREFALLRAFLDRPGAVLSRAQLEEKLYGWDDSIESNAVEVYIHALRKKLGSDFIKNVRGVGYMVAKTVAKVVSDGVPNGAPK